MITLNKMVDAALNEQGMAIDELKFYRHKGYGTLTKDDFMEVQNFLFCLKRANAFLEFVRAGGEYNDVVKEGFDVYSEIASRPE